MLVVVSLNKRKC